jgi:hypothetical protein
LITQSPTEGDIPLVADAQTATVYVDPTDHSVTEIAAADLCRDLRRVTGERPSLVESMDAVDGVGVVVGTVGESAGVDACLSEANFDVSTFSGRRESYRIETVQQPTQNIDACVVAAGSDRRGTAYGVYDLAQAFGVSPWYWWADVQPEQHDTIAVEAGSYEDGPPSVKYRGIFLNDEDFGLRPWATKTHASGDSSDSPGVGPETYERIFELLLRLKANTVWPAMHPDTKAFYRYPEHAELADRYAIIVGTSHCEPMHRNNVDEWDEDRDGPWSYVNNRDRVKTYWRDRVEAVADYENLFTIGMRNIHDSGLPDGETLEEKRAILERVIEDQRDMLEATHGRDAETIPQVFCPYKEVLDLYRGGLDVPDDVCIMWPDDNYGYLRALPNASELERPGGHGVYYHFSYWGQPHCYLWQSAIPLGLANQELTRAYDAGAQEYWVANVGDIKPTEKEMEYFLDLAWDVEGVDELSPTAWLEQWAAREFGSEHATDIASALQEYYRLAQSRQPEHMGWSTVYPDTQPDDPAFSLTHGGDEVRRRVETFDALDERMTEIYDSLPASDRPAFYELVVYPVRTAGAMSAKYLHALRSRRYAGQGRVTANEYGVLAERAHQRIVEETRYYNDSLLDGKWEHMMSYHPRDLPVFEAPRTASVDDSNGSGLGVIPEGNSEPVQEGAVHPPSVPTLDPRIDRDRFIDLFARGDDPVEWSAEPSEPWIEMSDTGGTVEDEKRVQIGADWTAVPDDGATGTVSLYSHSAPWGYGNRKDVRVRAAPSRETDAGFAVVDGLAAMEAEHATVRCDGSRARWVDARVPGRISRQTVAVAPSVFESYEPDADGAPALEFTVDVCEAETFKMDVYCIPTQSLTVDSDLRYAVDFGQDRTVISIDPDGGEHDHIWQQNVLRGAAVGTTRHEVTSGGVTQLTLEALDPGLVVDRIVVFTGKRPETYLGPRETLINR